MPITSFPFSAKKKLHVVEISGFNDTRRRGRSVMPFPFSAKKKPQVVEISGFNDTHRRGRPVMPSPDPAKQHASARVPHQKMQGHTSVVQCVLRLPGQQRIITGSWDGSLRVWDLQRGTQVGKKWKDKGSAGVQAIALSPDSKRVASGSHDGAVRLWDVDTGKVIEKWMGHSTKFTVQSVCWSPDGRRVVSGSWDRTFRVWDVESGETILGPIDAGGAVRAVSYSPDGTIIATGGDSLQVWDANTCELLKTLQGPVFCMVWTSDGKTLIAGSYNVRLFNTATWRGIDILGGNEGAINEISLSPDERIVASTSYNSTTRLWNLKNNLPIGPPLYHDEKVVRCVAFSADGRFIATGCDDHHAHTWDVSAIVKKANFDDLLSDDVSSPASLPTDIRSSQNATNEMTFMKRFRDVLRYYRSRAVSVFTTPNNNVSSVQGLKPWPRGV